MTTRPSRYKMTISLNVLNHLGLNLYSNVPAVLSEVIANSWDADAKNVSISILSNPERIEIMDDGIGMDEADINDKYLNVGYERRQQGEAYSQQLRRPVMGRKGIGKLSLFSIAGTVEVHSMKAGQRCSFRMRIEDIRREILAGNSVYPPQEIPADTTVQGSHGTLIRISDFKRRLLQTETFLKKRLARRFSIIGAENSFDLVVNGTPVTVADRDYFHKLQYIWTYGDKGHKISSEATNAQRKFRRGGEVEDTSNIWGWIGTVEKSGALKEDEGSINRVTVLVRGKLAQEDILEEIGESGLYAQYVIGEINADFLDTDNEDDIATSSRQRIIEDDPRYIALRRFLSQELKYIQSQWTGIRNEDGLKKAQEIPAIAEWYSTLPKDYQASAKRLFGKINQLPVEVEHDRRVIMKNSVLAFESLRYKHNLDKLEHVSIENLPAVAEIFAEYDDIEATLYYQIIRERLAIIRALHAKVDEAAKEKVIQKHVFTHLWLLDQSWERVTGTEVMERAVKTEFDKVDAGLSDAEKDARFDLKYRTTSRKHVIIELKKPDRVVSSFDLARQVDKYRNALRKVLRSVNRPDEAMEFVCVVGRELQDWNDPQSREESAKMLAAKDTRVVMYQQLIDSAQAAYADYLRQDEHAGRVYQLIQQLDEWVAEQPEEE